MYVWPYIERQDLAMKNDYTLDFYVPPGTIGGTMDGLCGQYVSLYYCPSDLGADQDQAGIPYPRRRGNYVVNWGNALYAQSGTTSPPPSIPGTAPFAHLGGNRTTPKMTRMRDITDGTSSTLMMSEYLKASSPNDNDWRGDIHNDDGVFRFHTLNTPNSSVKDDVGWAVDNGDPATPVNPGVYPQHNAARSRHTAGVNVALCDGSVRFVSNGISLQTWRWLGTMDGGEVVGDF
jgi:prepilin-type processing-associated H-X9-DG protein